MREPCTEPRGDWSGEEATWVLRAKLGHLSLLGGGRKQASCIPDPPAPNSQVLGLKACTAVPSLLFKELGCES